MDMLALNEASDNETLFLAAAVEVRVPARQLFHRLVVRIACTWPDDVKATT